MFLFLHAGSEDRKTCLAIISYHGQYTLQTQIHNSGEIIYFAKVPKT